MLNWALITDGSRGNASELTMFMMGLNLQRRMNLTCYLQHNFFTSLAILETVESYAYAVT